MTTEATKAELWGEIGRLNNALVSANAEVERLRAALGHIVNQSGGVRSVAVDALRRAAVVETPGEEPK